MFQSEFNSKPKNYYNYEKINSILMLALLMIAAMSFTACGGSDDNDGSGGGRDNSVLGTWVMDNAAYRFSCGWQFNADGTCAFGEWDYKGTPRFPSSGGVSWTTSGNTLRISAGPESASFTYTVTDNGKTLVLVAQSKGDNYSEMEGTYTKQ